MHGDNIIACSAAEVADRIAVIEGLEEEQKSSAAQRCARIYAECNRKPGEIPVCFTANIAFTLYILKHFCQTSLILKVSLQSASHSG